MNSWSDLTQQLGWIDWTALVIVATCFLLGLLKGLVWQVGRILGVVVAYLAASHAGPPVAGHLFGAAAGDGPRYLCSITVFLAVLIAVTLLTGMLRTSVRRSGLSAFDRLGGGLVGVGAGGGVVVACLAGMLMLGERSPFYADVQESRAVEVSRQALAAASDVVPDPVLQVFGVLPPAPVRDAPRQAETPSLDGLLRELDRGR